MVEDQDDSPTFSHPLMEPSICSPAVTALSAGIHFASWLATTLLVKGLNFASPSLTEHPTPSHFTSPPSVRSNLASQLTGTAPSVRSTILVAPPSVGIGCTSYGHPIHFITPEWEPTFTFACQISTIKGHHSSDLAPRTAHAKPSPLAGGDLVSFLIDVAPGTGRFTPAAPNLVGGDLASSLADVAPSIINIHPAAPSTAGDTNHGPWSYATSAHISIHEAC